MIEVAVLAFKGRVKAKENGGVTNEREDNMIGQFPSCFKLLFRNEAKCESINMTMTFHSKANIGHFHKKGFCS